MNKPTIARAHPRQSKRLKISLGPTTMFTLDVSAGGLCFETMRLPARGSTLIGALNIGGVDLAFEGIVAWVRPGDGRLAQRGRCGIRFVKVDRRLSAALATPLPASSPPAPVARHPLAPTAPRTVPGRANDDPRPTMTLQGEVWVIHSPAHSGRRAQEYRCLDESKARSLLTALGG